MIKNQKLTTAYVLFFYLILGGLKAYSNPHIILKNALMTGFQCPKSDNLGQPDYIINNTLGTTHSLEYYSRASQPIASLSAIESAWKYFLVQASPLIESQFGKVKGDESILPENIPPSNVLPAKIVLIATDEIAPLAGLFCETVQKVGSITIYINPEIANSPTELASQIAHEFVHYYFYARKLTQQNYVQPLWLEEGMALYFEYLVTGQLKGAAINAHLETPWTSLNDFSTDDLMLTLSAYGHAQLLFLYLHNQLGTNLIKNILVSGKTGIAALNEVISHTPNRFYKNFNEAFIDFEIAKRINRIDYAVSDEKQQKRYFIFSTTLKAKDTLKPDNFSANRVLSDNKLTAANKLPIKPLSSVCFSKFQKTQSPQPQCFAIQNNLSKPIQVMSCAQSVVADFFLFVNP